MVSLIENGTRRGSSPGGPCHPGPPLCRRGTQPHLLRLQRQRRLPTSPGALSCPHWLSLALRRSPAGAASVGLSARRARGGRRHVRPSALPVRRGCREVRNDEPGPTGPAALTTPRTAPPRRVSAALGGSSVRREFSQGRCCWDACEGSRVESSWWVLFFFFF